MVGLHTGRLRTVATLSIHSMVRLKADTTHANGESA